MEGWKREENELGVSGLGSESVDGLVPVRRKGESAKGREREGGSGSERESSSMNETTRRDGAKGR